MADLFKDKADDYDSRSVPQQISEGVVSAMTARLALSLDLTVMDFGAGTGLIANGIAPLVAHLHAVDISPSMLAALEKKPALQGKVTIHCQDILTTPLGLSVDLVVSAMAMHHVDDTEALLRTLYAHLKPGGQLGLADLDAEDGTFHPPGIEGVFHDGFDRAPLVSKLERAGFVDITIDTAAVVHRDGKDFPVFLATARRD